MSTLSIRSSMEICAVTYNIHRGLNTVNKYDLGAIIDVLRAQDAQIVALQEVCRNWSQETNWDDQVEIIKTTLGMDAVFSASISVPLEENSKGKREYGNLLLSTFPIESSSTVRMYLGDDPSLKYDGTSETEPRSFISAQLNIEGQSLKVIATHLSFHSSQERLRQIEKILKVLKAEQSEHCILMGDLNAVSGSAELSTLKKYFEDSSFGKGPITMPSQETQIDYILTKGVTVANIEAVESDASDHLPLRADITV